MPMQRVSVRIEPARVVTPVAPKRPPHARAGGGGLRAGRGRPQAPAMTLLTLYSKPDCHLCVEAHAALMGLRSELGFDISEVDITTDEALHRAYFERIPVVVLDGEE